MLFPNTVAVFTNTSFARALTPSEKDLYPEGGLHILLVLSPSAAPRRLTPSAYLTYALHFTKSPRRLSHSFLAIANTLESKKYIFASRLREIMLNLLPIRLWIGSMLFGTIGSPQRPAGARVRPSRVIKGPCHVNELEALEYISKNTTIPVPRIWRTFYYHKELYIEMEFIRGDDLSTAWRKRLSPEQKEHVVQEIARYIKQLRSLKPVQDSIVGSANYNACYDGRLGSSSFGPFQNHDAFHLFLRGGIPLDNSTQIFGEVVTRSHMRRYKSHFSHADLSLQNILIKDGKVAAIIDWEFAGWYPEYWEYTKAHYNMLNMPDFYKLFTQYVPKYDEELAAERALWRLYDAPGDALGDDGDEVSE
ncbi:MAG: hypothetical protein M1818_003733 [Claussenomyces sp. TS43310]|nr:MAG: hypothetical protein M1818_003733 [Claussenomyces sp. TS43310]